VKSVAQLFGWKMDEAWGLLADYRVTVRSDYGVLCLDTSCYVDVLCLDTSGYVDVLCLDTSGYVDVLCLDTSGYVDVL
jgi:uncharacterized protein YjbK